MRDAITQSASFEKERPMDPLSSCETKRRKKKSESAKITINGRLNSEWTLRERYVNVIKTLSLLSMLFF